jgi:hypothetical protein
MNEKIQAILLKIVLDLKKLKWSAGPDWEITLKSEGHIPLVKKVLVDNTMSDNKFRDEIDTMIDLTLITDDQITYFPNFTIYGSILIDGGPSKDIAVKQDVDVAFTDKDFQNAAKIVSASKKVNNMVESYIENEYDNYIDTNSKAINAYKQGGWKADDETRGPTPR